MCAVFFLKNTRLDLSCSGFVVWCFSLFFEVWFFIPIKKHVERKNKHGKKTQNPKCRKHPKFVFVSAVVFTNRAPNFGGGLKNANLC